MSRNRDMSGSAGRRLAAAGGVDVFLELVEADGADHDIGADHVARRAVEPKLFGELQVLLDGLANLVAGQIFFDPRDVESGLLGGGKRACLVGLTAAAEQLLV